jgi:hypothetical protein
MWDWVLQSRSHCQSYAAIDVCSVACSPTLTWDSLDLYCCMGGINHYTAMQLWVGLCVLWAGSTLSYTLFRMSSSEQNQIIKIPGGSVPPVPRYVQSCLKKVHIYSRLKTVLWNWQLCSSVLVFSEALGHLSFISNMYFFYMLYIIEVKSWLKIIYVGLWWTKWH